MLKYEEMKTIVCYRCKKTIEVPEDWTYKACQLCKTKEKARKQVQKEKRRLDREAGNKIKELKLEPSTMSFSEWQNFAREKLPNVDPAWDNYIKTYLKPLRERRVWKKASDEERKIRFEHSKKMREARRLLRFRLYEKTSKNCEKFRLLKLQVMKPEQLQISPYFTEDHLDRCESCRLWNDSFEDGTLEPEPELEKDKSWIQAERDDSEFPFEKLNTIPDHSLDRFKPTQQSEAETINDVLQKGNIRVESQPEQDQQSTEPQTDQDFISQLENSYLKRKSQSENQHRDTEENPQ